VLHNTYKPPKTGRYDGKMKIDLHIHSRYAPNGKLPLRDIFERAKAVGIGALAVTDSYCIDGIPEALELGREYGITVVKGVEMQADSRVHILCYKFDENNEALRTMLKQARQWTSKGRLERIFQNLTGKYRVCITLEDVCRLLNTSAPSTKQICEALAKLGIAIDWKAAKAKYFAPDSPNGSCYVGALYSPEQLVAFGKQAGGRAILAHPHQIERKEVSLDELMTRLANAGLDGIEVHYNNQFTDDAKRQAALELKEKHGLSLVSGGSDFEGEAITCLGGEPQILSEMVSAELLEE